VTATAESSPGIQKQDDKTNYAKRAQKDAIHANRTQCKWCTSCSLCLMGASNNGDTYIDHM